jgi:hypothetical protein
MACDKRYGEDDRPGRSGSLCNIADKVHCYAWCAMHFGRRLVTWLALGLAPVASLVDEPWPRSALIDDPVGAKQARSNRYAWAANVVA